MTSAGQLALEPTEQVGSVCPDRERAGEFVRVCPVACMFLAICEERVNVGAKPPSHGPRSSLLDVRYVDA